MPPRTAADARCPYCLATLTGEEVVVACAGCGTRHHRACFLEHGTCTIYACGADGFADAAAVEAAPWSRHPFLPLGGALEPRPPAFLSVGPAEIRRRRGQRAGGATELRLELPDHGVCGSPLEGVVHLRLPRAVAAQGLRLETQALALHEGREVPLYHEEAVLLGRARRTWLERLKVWSRSGPPLALAGGRTRVPFAFDPGRLHWEGPLPWHAAVGSWHVLRVRAVLDAVDLPLASRASRVVVTHTHGRCRAGGGASRGR